MTTQSTKSVLVADDDDASRELLVTLLEGEGYETLSARSGWQALRIFREQPVDLALLDGMMPGQNGFAVCRAARGNATTRLIPIVMVTALSGTSDRILGIEAGADDFL